MRQFELRAQITVRFGNFSLRKIIRVLQRSLILFIPRMVLVVVHVYQHMHEKYTYELHINVDTPTGLSHKLASSRRCKYKEMHNSILSMNFFIFTSL